VTFKEFQRLPDWPQIKVIGGRCPSEGSEKAKGQTILPSHRLGKSGPASQTFAE